jgi:hypothetical protein
MFIFPPNLPVSGPDFSRFGTDNPEKWPFGWPEYCDGQGRTARLPEYGIGAVEELKTSGQPK